MARKIETPYTGKPLKILSLFDGISGITRAAELAGIPIDTIFRSDIDPYTNAIAEKNWKGKVNIEYLGNILDIDPDFLRRNEIDLVTGGPPCQDFSRLHAGGKGLEGPKSALAKKYIELIQKADPSKLKFLMEETTMTPEMKAEVAELFREKLNLKNPLYPAVVDARHFSPTSRKRLWWHYGFDNSLPGVTDKDVDYTNYKYKNEKFDPTEILNSDIKEGQTLKDFDLTTKPHNQEDWHSMTPWVGALLASMGRNNDYPKARDQQFERGYDSFIVRKNPEGNWIYDPSKIDKRRGVLVYDADGNPITTTYGNPERKYAVHPTYNRKARGNLDMEPNEIYEGRVITPEEGEIVSGFPAGYTKLDEDTLERIQYNLAHAPEGSDLWQYKKYAGDSMTKGSENYRYHGLGNGWQAITAEYILRRLFGLGGYDEEWSDERLKNITSAISKRFY